MRWLWSVAAVTFGSTQLIWSADALSQEIALIGMARGNDYSAPPPNWRVWVAAYVNGTQGQTRTSEGELYYYPVRATTGQVKLVFWRTGYRGVGEDLVLNGGSPLRRDVVLRRIQSYSTGSVAERSANLQRELNEQAELAKLGGTEARDVFLWNLHLYEQIYRNSELSRDVRDFSSRADVTSMRMQGFQLERASLYERISEQESGGAPRIGTEEIVRGMENPSLGSVIRSELIRILSRDGTSDELRPTTIEALRRVALGTDPAVAVAAFTALLRIGGTSDRSFVLQSAESSNSEHAVAAVGAIGAVRFPEGVDALVRMLQNRTDPRLRIVATHALVAVAPQRALPLLGQMMSATETPQVTLSALEAFQSARISQADSAALRQALVRLQSHPNLEVRAEARRALGTENRSGPRE
jgi:HEAT repeats